MDTDPTTVDNTSQIRNDQAVDEGIELVEDELLVEEISIDGMCGVY